MTIIVPTYNRCQDLDRCLRALHAQTLAADSFEVIVVDDGSTDATPETLRRWAENWTGLRYYRQSNSGPAAARNRGIQNARGAVIAFTDDDCVPPPTWAQRIHDRFQAGLRGCLHGAVTSSLPSSTFIHSVIANGAVITSDLAVERNTFDTIGLFDTNFRAPWCEDADICYRMTKAAIPITYDAGLIVDHPPRYQRFANSIRKSRFFQYYGLIAHKHPEMEPLSGHSDRLILAIRKLCMILIMAFLLRAALNIPVFASLFAMPVAYGTLDALRLRKMKSNLAAHGIRIRWQDQVLYVLFNWFSNILEGYYTVKGAIIYRRPHPSEK